MFAISGHNLPRAKTYEEAQRVWEESHQHDRFGDHYRGLVNKRDTSKTVSNMDGVYRFRYHHTDIVEYWKDLLVVRVHDSRSTVIFANRFLPSGIHAESIKGEMYVAQNGHYYVPKKSSLEFRLKDGKWVLDEFTAHAFDVFTLDKSLAAKIRTKLKPLRERRDALLRLRNGQHRAELRSEGGMCEVLNQALMFKALDEDVIRMLLNYTATYDDKILLPNAYLVGGAVKKETVVGVQRQVNSPYSGRTGRLYL